MTLVLWLPLPPKELSPNAGKKWNVHKINRITQKAQSDTIARIFEQQSRGEPLTRATVTVTFVVPTRGRRDLDNLIAAAKPFMDALTLAGVIKDDDAKTIKMDYRPIEYRKGISETIIEVNDGIFQ